MASQRAADVRALRSDAIADPVLCPCGAERRPRGADGRLKQFGQNCQREWDQYLNRARSRKRYRSPPAGEARGEQAKSWGILADPDVNAFLMKLARAQLRVRTNAASALEEFDAVVSEVLDLLEHAALPGEDGKRPAIDAPHEERVTPKAGQP